jgi:hypothetical protein
MKMASEAQASVNPSFGNNRGFSYAFQEDRVFRRYAHSIWTTRQAATCLAILTDVLFLKTKGEKRKVANGVKD